VNRAPEPAAYVGRMAARVDQVTRALQDTAERLTRLSGEQVPWLPDTENRHAAYPFFQVEGDRISYLAHERDRKLFERRTRDLDVFLC